MMLYAVKRFILCILATVKWHGWKCPLWFTVGAPTFRLKGKHYREVERVVRPGDILVRRFDGYVNCLFIPGWWNHVGIYCGPNAETGEPHEVIHAVPPRVTATDLIDFARTDHLLVLRLEEEGDSWRRSAVTKARALEKAGTDYDFAFDFVDPTRQCCTEMLAACYPGIKCGKRRWGRYTIVPDDYVAYTVSDVRRNRLRIVWDSRPRGRRR